VLTSAQLKQITAEARPIIERQLDDALKLAGLRDVVAAAGGDWSQLKALIKAQIQDEETGDGKRVRKILDKAEYANAYADMLGLGGANMNEENFIADALGITEIMRHGVNGPTPEHDADGVIIEPEAAMLPQAAGSETAVANSTPGSGAGTVDAGEANWPSEMTTASPANEPETIPPVADPATVVSEAANGDSAPSLAAIPVADRSKPNPICRDPGDCGVYASWHLTCEKCKAAAAHRVAA